MYIVGFRRIRFGKIMQINGLEIMNMLIYLRPNDLKGSKYKSCYLTFLKERELNNIDKREWFLADGVNSFFLFNRNSLCNKIYMRPVSKGKSFIDSFFENYYLSKKIKSGDFVLKTIGPNEVSIFDSDEKEFVQIESKWKFRHHKNFTSYLVNKLQMEYKVAHAVLYYALKCSQKHISSIIWIPNNLDDSEIEKLTMPNRIKIWKEKLNVMNENHEALINKVLASDGAIVLDKDGNLCYESVFANMNSYLSMNMQLSGSGETATRLLASNGIAIKISQDGAIKIYCRDEKWCY